MACLKSMHGARESHAPAAPAALGGSDRCAQELKVEVQTDAVGEPHGFVSVSIWLIWHVGKRNHNIKADNYDCSSK